MITPPTDRLHKFLAVAGIALVVFGVRTSVVAYDETKQKEFQFMKSFRPAQDAHADYIKHVNDARALGNALVKDPTEQNKKALNEFLERTDVQSDHLYQEVKKLDNANISDLDYAEHSRVMRIVWFIIAAASISIGSIISYIGFSQWFGQPKKLR